MKQFYMVVISFGLILSLCTAAYPQVNRFSIYTFQRDASLKIGYPEGWTVSEAVDETGSVLSAVITRSGTPDSEGFIFYLIPFPQNTEIQDSRQFAGMAIDRLRSTSLPTLMLEKDYGHASLEQIHVSELSLDSDGTRFLGKSWSAFLKGQGAVLGIFALFYGPQTTFGNFNTDEMLAGLISPIFGGQAAPSPPPATAPGGHLDPRFFGTWALHTTVAANTMMQENTYNSDGTFVIRQYASGPMMSTSPYGRGSASQTLHGNWWIQDGNFHLRWEDGKVAVYSFSFEGNFLDMRGVNVRESLKFRKVTQ
ncbi:MAG: hypothetical protein JXQ27_09045 [Acidobacteria bacterium]|nr:hypothetical protein [Acidobacteriota bacterium]